MEHSRFFDASAEALAHGYEESEDHFTCLICEACFEKGVIYTHGNLMYDARKRMELHIEQEHHGMLEYLLSRNPDLLGLSGMQLDMVKLFASNLSDQEIARQQKLSASTIRSYRFKLREKEKQAKLFLVLMQLLAAKTKQSVKAINQTELSDAPKTATTLDERFNITLAEKKKYQEQYFDETGALKEYPAREKRKIIILEVIAQQFKLNQRYREEEVNRILKRIYEDFATIRRALIEYGFLDRSDDGSSYWRAQ